MNPPRKHRYEDDEEDSHAPRPQTMGEFIREMVSLKSLVEQGVSIVVALGAIVSFAWIFADPVIEKYVDKVIEQHQLSTRRETQDLKDDTVAATAALERRVNRVEDVTERDNAAIIKLQSQMETLEDLAREQRQDTKIILQRLPPSK
ncbi:hypothetical protein [Aestuariivirga sp.]|uniref:hypothetical protein n=1 Tax=Aestuariivirga sp. TaxID=2650926 RepID=UPI0039E56CF3